jgi:NADH/NAD ratio-sensing transcriptional regulator Rex
VAPVFPMQEVYRARIVAVLKDKGVDGILSFKSMLLDIVDRVDTRNVYPKSELLQLVRTLKTFDLIKDSQMNFLG